MPLPSKRKTFSGKEKVQKKASLFLNDDPESELPWFKLLSPFFNDSTPSSETFVSFTPGQLELLRTKGQQLIESQEKAFLDHISNDLSFYLNLLNEGTRADRLAAYGLLVAKAPHFFISKLADWMTWISSGMNRAESIGDAISSLAQVFSNHIVPTNRKLKYMEQRHGPKIPSDPELWAWAVEDSLKRAYADLIRLFERQLASPYEQLRLRLLPIISGLLSTHPEQESALLSLLFSKLGDASKKVASSSGRSILKVINQHPAMTEIVVTGLWQQMLTSKAHKSSASALHAQYYGVVLLTQVPLDSRFQDLARKMISMYVSLIEDLFSESSIKSPVGNAKQEQKKKKDSEQQGKQDRFEKQRRKEEHDFDPHEEKLLSVILKGIHTAFSACKDAQLPSIDMLFKLTHVGSWPKSLQALWLLYKISKQIPSLEERFRKSLWESLVDYRSFGHGWTRAEQHISLIKSFLMDRISSSSFQATLPVILAFVKRWLGSISVSGSIPFACAILQSVLEVFVAICYKKPTILKDIVLPPGDHKNAWDPFKRDPSWSGIAWDPSSKKLSCSLFEICPLLLHYHPSVSALAKAVLLSTKGISSKALPNPEVTLKNATKDPFESYSLISFLDRWAYKNPKKRANTEAPIPSTTSFSSLPSGDVDAPDIFYHKYFANKTKRITSTLSIPRGEDNDSENDLHDIDLATFDDSEDTDINVEDSLIETDSDDNGSIDNEDAIDDFISEKDGSIIDDDDDDLNNTSLLSDDHNEEYIDDGIFPKESETVKRKRVKLPMLASAEDYEEYLN